MPTLSKMFKKKNDTDLSMEILWMSCATLYAHYPKIQYGLAQKWAKHAWFADPSQTDERWPKTDGVIVA